MGAFELATPYLATNAQKPQIGTSQVSLCGLAYESEPSRRYQPQISVREGTFSGWLVIGDAPLHPWMHEGFRSGSRPRLSCGLAYVWVPSAGCHPQISVRESTLCGWPIIGDALHPPIRHSLALSFATTSPPTPKVGLNLVVGALTALVRAKFSP